MAKNGPMKKKAHVAKGARLEEKAHRYAFCLDELAAVLDDMAVSVGPVLDEHLPDVAGAENLPGYYAAD